MKKVFAITMFLLVMLLAVTSLQAYTVNDSIGDAIGVLTFESYGINVYNFTPGVYSGNISFDIFTNYPKSGLTVGEWNTTPADLFITETYYGHDYLWAIPLVNHGSFSAGRMYAVGSYKVSDDFEPAGGGYTYNHNVPVQIATLGNNYGWTSFNGGLVTWNSLAGSPANRINIPTGIYEDDPNGKFSYLWGTATCANDVVSSPVPEPGSMMLLGTGLIGMIGFARHGIRKRQT